MAGFCLGLLLDGIHLDGATQIPALVFLGFLWGRLGLRGLPIQKSFNLGLLAWAGSFLAGLSLWLQLFVKQQVGTLPLFNAWSVKTLFSESLATALLAPLICSWFTLLLRNRRIIDKV